MTAASRRIPERLRGASGLVLIATALTLAMAAPVMRAPGSRLFGHELVGRHEAPFIVINQFENPRPLGLYTQPATDYLGAAVAAVTGDGVIAYNVVVLASFPLAALFAYLFAFELTRSRAAAWLAGLLYAFAPFHVAQSAYHPHGSQTQWLPLYFLALWLCVRDARARRLLLLAASLILVVLSNFYYGLLAAVLTPFALLGFSISQRHIPDGSTRGLSRTVGALAAAAAAGVGYVAAFAPAVLERRAQLAFPPGDLALYGARASSYLTPPAGHPLLGSWVDELWRQRGLGGVLEQQITIGFALLLLAAVAVGAYLAGARFRPLQATPALLVTGAAAFVFSLAPAAGAGAASLLRPSELIYALLPMFRAYARFGLVAFLAAAVLAGAGAVWLLATRWRPLRFAAWTLIALAAVELAPFPPFRWRDVLPTSAHRFLNDADRPVRLLDCVPPTRVAQLPSFQRFRHHVSMLDAGADCGDPAFPLRVSNEGFTHYLVRKPSPLAAWLTSRPPPRGARPVGEFGDALLFELEPRSPSLFLEFGGGFSWREYLGDRTYRWMASRGSLTITNSTAGTRAVRIALELHTFPGPRAVLVRLAGSELAELEVGTESAFFPLPAVELGPGRHPLELRSLSPAVVADSVLHNGDQRELAVALGRWRISAAD